MDQEQFLERVYALRQEGKSIRAIASELGTYKTKVQRVLKSLAAPSDPDAMARNIDSRVFVGRKHEMEELQAALADARSGRARITMLSGEPGIGKTRLAQEIAMVGRNLGVQTLWGRCYEGQGAPPYWPWVQIIRDYVREQDVNQLRAETGAGAASIAEIVPELGKKLPRLSLHHRLIHRRRTASDSSTP